MSLPCHDCFSDLLCGEDSTGLLSEEEPEDYYLGDIVLAADVEELMAELVAEERDYCPASDYRTRLLDAASAREEAVTWILKVHAYYHFQPLTAYLSVNYMDRFLASHGLPQANNGWPLQLLSVASLSLAAKMEETFVPSLLDLQVESARFIFEPRTIRRMELLVLNALNWRLRSVTPFDFIDFFSLKMDPSGAYAGFLVSHATQFILATIHGTKFLEHWPSSVAAAAIICAADSLPNLSLAYPGDAVSWCLGLNKENIVSCHALLQGVVVSNSSGNNNKLHKLPKVVSKLNARTPTELGFGDSSSSSGTTSQKRRKLNSLLWGYDSTSHSDSGDGI